MTYIKINPRRVYETGMQYHNYADRIVESQKKLRKINENIGEAWTGAASHNFQVTLEKHTALLDSIIDFLEEKSFILKENALNHNTSDNNFRITMERSDIDEQSANKL